MRGSLGKRIPTTGAEGGIDRAGEGGRVVARAWESVLEVMLLVANRMWVQFAVGVPQKLEEALATLNAKY
jgi:hypothetical protein